MSFINREISWLEFNQRVLEQALSPELPLLERLKFLAITASNMDEFFQVRVGGLQLMRLSGSRKRGISGLTPIQQLACIHERALKITQDQYQLLNQELLPAMAREGMTLLSSQDLKPHHHEILAQRFAQSISPLLTPLAFSEDSTPPTLPALKVIIACELKSEEQEDLRIVLVPVPDQISRFIHIPANDGSSGRTTRMEHLLSLIHI